MTARESFLAAMRFDTTVPVPKAEFGYWTTAVKRFLREGLHETEALPARLSDNGTITGADRVDPDGSEVPDRNVRPACGLDSYAAKFPCDYSPLLPARVLEDEPDYRVVVDRYGITKKERKGGTTPPLDLAFPVTCRADFEAYKEHYDSDYSRRLPRTWKTLAPALGSRSYPLRLGGFPFGFLGMPRHLLGTEGLFLAMYDDPQLVKDINAFYLRFVMDYWSPLIEAARPDCVMIWEDMASATGSMISPGAFREFLSPFYRTIIGFLREHGVDNIHVDSDGSIEDLIPLWVELGVTGIFPMERKAGNDLLRIRARFPRLQLLGGIDKRILAQGRTAADIEAELAVAARLLAQGGFIPHVDHHVPDDACWENFRAYRLGLNRLIDEAARG
jgi:uroporphyrinogen decarboxylase